MAARTVDARGLPCPQPVILTRNAMREGDAEQIITLVTGNDQVGNVRRLAERAGWQVAVEEQEQGYAVTMTKGETVVEPELAPDVMSCELPSGSGAVITVTSSHMGHGDDELGGILIRAFFHTLTEVEPLPATIIFYNTGVRLAVKGSPIVEDLVTLEGRGVEILVCGTCLGYFELKDQLGAGVVSNMYTIAETLLAAGHVISP